VKQSEQFYAALRRAGAEATFVKVVGAGHGFGGPQVAERVRAFFDRHLRGRKVEVAETPIPAPKKE
jgi:dipeptidyl aminopeptidase/acylaminoacyl peptidase